MKRSLVIVSPFYRPETGAAAKRITSVAEFLVNHNWEVTVVTLLPHYPQNQIYEGYNVHTPYVCIENGVTVIRLRPWIVPRTNLIKRLLSETLFALQAALYIVKNRSDIVLASSPYMFLGPFSLIASRISGKKFIWDVRDLTWEYPKATGKATYGLDKLIRAFMFWTARQANGLVAVTDGILKYFYKKNIYHEVIPNGVDDDLLNCLSEIPYRVIDQKRIPRVLYAGLLGYNQHLSTLLDAAKLLPEISFIICGDGPERKYLEEKKQNLRICNVEFKGYINQKELIREYENADILYAQLVAHPIHKWSEPSKLWEYMATGKPIIYGGIGSMAELIEKNELGIIIPPEDPEALVQAIRMLLNNPKKALSLGKNGRCYVKKYRKRSVLLANLEEFLRKILEG